jgi:hypothetical protein
MTHCPCCNHDVVEAPPSRAYWGLIGAFWAFSLLFGLGAGLFTGWSFVLVLAWLFLATITATFLRGSMTWTCPECAAVLPMPARPGMSALPHPA